VLPSTIYTTVQAVATLCTLLYTYSTVLTKRKPGTKISLSAEGVNGVYLNAGVDVKGAKEPQRSDTVQYSTVRW